MTHSRNGYVYVLSNQSMPGLLKIGRTRSLERRIRELSGTTSVPSMFVMETCHYTHIPSIFEAWVHQLLRDYRVSSRREFFRCDIEAVSAAFETANEHEQAVVLAGHWSDVTPHLDTYRMYYSEKVLALAETYTNAPVSA